MKLEFSKHAKQRMIERGDKIRTNKRNYGTSRLYNKEG